MTDDADVIIVGGGHNGLVAAAYLAKAGRRVVVVEARHQLGGAVSGEQSFSGMAARLSRFSYLVSLFPDVIITDLDLDLDTRSRQIASYTPIGARGLLVERDAGPLTRASFAQLTGSDDEHARWEKLASRLQSVASVVAPTLTGPLPRAADIRNQLPAELWTALVERPIGELLEEALTDDTVRGVVATDALIGTFASLADPSRRQNRCFLYHVIGNGSGEWKVPVGGMGRVASQLSNAAERAGAALITDTRVARIQPDEGGGGTVVLAGGSRHRSPFILANCAPSVLHSLLGNRADSAPEGSQIKINLLVRRLPRFRSGMDPRIGFGGTLHLKQGYRRLEQAYEQATTGQIPDPLPCEVYCHTLTDPSVMSAELRNAGYHTLTLFGLHTPARLFVRDPSGARDQAKRAALRALQSVLAEPLEDCLAVDAQGRPCVEVMSPLDLEAELGMPGGHIFHGDLSWPWLPDDTIATNAAERWGVATDYPGILLCGAGAVRGGAVSGLGGHNAARAVIETAQPPLDRSA
jgi:phytoene dehydrogenase-like protein